MPLHKDLGQGEIFGIFRRAAVNDAAGTHGVDRLCIKGAAGIGHTDDGIAKESLQNFSVLKGLAHHRLHGHTRGPAVRDGMASHLVPCITGLKRLPFLLGECTIIDTVEVESALYTVLVEKLY